MKSSQLFLGFTIAFLLTVFSANAAKQRSFLNTKKKVETGNQTRAYGVSTTGQPTNSSENIPGVKVATSRSNLPTSFNVRSNQEIICFLEIRFEKLKFEDHQTSPVFTLNRFFVHLFTVIISPNAP